MTVRTRFAPSPTGLLHIGRVRTVESATPVVRVRNPQDGAVIVDDAMHGKVVFQNAELDDLIIERS